jgi:hypothetical protein
VIGQPGFFQKGVRIAGVRRDDAEGQKLAPSYRTGSSRNGSEGADMTFR